MENSKAFFSILSLIPNIICIQLSKITTTFKKGVFRSFMVWVGFAARLKVRHRLQGQDDGGDEDTANGHDACMQIRF